MTDEQPPTPPGLALTDLQRARLDYARRDLDEVRAEDLGILPPDVLILIIEKLRRRLDDTLALVDEVADHSSERHP